MNIRIKKSKHFPVFLFTFGVIILLLPSCSKAPDDFNTVVSTSAVNFIEASPDEPPIDLYLNTTKFSSAVSYGQNTNYSVVNSGSYYATFSSDINASIILADSVNFAANTYYSLFLANKVTKPEVVLLTDSISQPASGYASLRFINLSPDAPNVDLVVKGGSVLVPNKAYKGHSSFAPIAGNVVYTLEVHQAGTATVLATLSNVKLQSNYVYTVWFHGLAAGTASTDQLSVDILTNASFL